MEATERMPLCTLAKALATGKTTNEINVLEKDEIRVDTYLTERSGCEATLFMVNELLG